MLVSSPDPWAGYETSKVNLQIAELEQRRGMIDVGRGVTIRKSTYLIRAVQYIRIVLVNQARPLFLPTTFTYSPHAKGVGKGRRAKKGSSLIDYVYPLYNHYLSLT